ncbi:MULTISPECIES: hypothetical protein [unclassified Rhodococcus (in: high G+C Gram-positive bacteria)]|uniref:hypothetical protein n=1 Tax=unclassified Rhodococcus (in: high G+C Gram-positive bacteria) TaxID=192944 RepID=UPI00163B1A64|nr:MULTISPECIES: hypothetical protein [unclassified Rhodococcus (in: high G+C Gram-positive bacteria)]MBC2642648.1 hypothetical protein [Rhodococcus sp. 3A]MBC2892610.1 hypothetical protein [Rhodococcus sp. 4CII]
MTEGDDYQDFSNFDQFRRAGTDGHHPYANRMYALLESNNLLSMSVAVASSRDIAVLGGLDWVDSADHSWGRAVMNTTSAAAHWHP